MCPAPFNPGIGVNSHSILFTVFPRAKSFWWVSRCVELNGFNFLATSCCVGTNPALSLWVVAGFVRGLEIHSKISQFYELKTSKIVLLVFVTHDPARVSVVHVWGYGFTASRLRIMWRPHTVQSVSRAARRCYFISLWKVGLNCTSKLHENNDIINPPSLHRIVCFKMHEKGFKSEAVFRFTLIFVVWKWISLLQRVSFLK